MMCLVADLSLRIEAMKNKPLPRDTALPKFHFVFGLGNWTRSYVVQDRNRDSARWQATKLAMQEAPFLEWRGEQLTSAYYGTLAQ